MKPLEMLVDVTIKVEKIRVQLQVRQSHLKLNDREDKLTDEALERVQDVERWVDKRVSELIVGHPAYPWFSRVKGIGKENIGKVVGQVRIKPEKGKDKNGNEINLPYADTISALWKFSGFAVEDNGKSPRRTEGVKSSYNGNLRSMCWRVGTSLMKATGVFYEYYLKEKEKYRERFTNEGTRVLPTPLGVYMCTNCGQSWNKKRDITPCCDNPTIEKVVREEPEGVIWEGHLHAMALRKMIKLFLACLWLVWRQVEGLPVTKPYAIDKLGHDSFIDPWVMVDREEET